MDENRLDSMVVTLLGDCFRIMTHFLIVMSR
jgi:hypothetical protein